MYDVITTTDKDARDRMFEDLRLNGNAAERQAVKFSDCEPVLDEYGLQEYTYVWYQGAKPDAMQPRPTFQSTFSVAYPTHVELTGRAARREAKRLKLEQEKVNEENQESQ